MGSVGAAQGAQGNQRKRRGDAPPLPAVDGHREESSGPRADQFSPKPSMESKRALFFSESTSLTPMIFAKKASEKKKIIKTNPSIIISDLFDDTSLILI